MEYPLLCLSLTALICVLFCPVSSLSQRSIPPDLQLKIDSFIQDTYLPSNNISSLVLTLVQNDGELLYTTGYGLANIEKNIPNGNSTQYLIASVTKTFTSVLVSKILHETFSELGEAVLDRPIRKLIPEANFTLSDRFRTEAATFRDLLAHRLCLMREDLLLNSEPFNSSEEVAYRQRYNPELCGMRSEFQYNNQIYQLAGELIGVLAGKSFEDAMQDLLDDLGMESSAFVQKTDNFTEMDQRAMPYFVRDNVAYPMNEDLIKRTKFVNAAAGLFTTPDDMSRYIRFLLNGGVLDGRRIVPEEVIEWQSKPSFIHPMHAYKSDDEELVTNYFAYGLGLMLASYDGWRSIQHGGHIAPYRSQLSLFPSQQLGIYTNTNMGPVPTMDQWALHVAIFEILRGHENPKKAAERVMREGMRQKTESRRFGQNGVKAAYHQPIEGKFGSGSGGEVEVSLRFREETNQTEYFLEHGLWYSGWLYPVPGMPEGVCKITLVTDAIQDLYSAGLDEIDYDIVFQGDKLSFLHPLGYFQSEFTLGLELEKLPPVPWEPGTCGPQD